MKTNVTQFCGVWSEFSFLKVRGFLCYIVPLPSTLGIANVSKTFLTSSLLQEVTIATEVSK